MNFPICTHLTAYYAITTTSVTNDWQREVIRKSETCSPDSQSHYHFLFTHLFVLLRQQNKTKLKHQRSITLTSCLNVTQNLFSSWWWVVCTWVSVLHKKRRRWEKITKNGCSEGFSCFCTLHIITTWKAFWFIRSVLCISCCYGSVVRASSRSSVRPPPGDTNFYTKPQCFQCSSSSTFFAHAHINGSGFRSAFAVVLWLTHWLTTMLTSPPLTRATLPRRSGSCS